MIKNIVFDIGNVILNFNCKEVLNKYTNNIDDQEFIMKNIINSPEWLEHGLIDTGYVTRKDAIKIVQDRTNHEKDDLIEDFWNNYNDYSNINSDMLELLKNIKNKGYNIYLLSNINSYTYNHIKKSGLFEIVDGYVLSYIEHQIKPYISIYNTLINRYKLNPKECLFIDDNINNIDTSNKIGMIGKKVIPDNYDSVVSVLKELSVLGD